MPVTKIPKKTVTLIEPKQSFIVDKKKHRQKRVAAYCRVSTDSEEQLTSYANQMKVYREMITAKRNGNSPGCMPTKGFPEQGQRSDRSFKR